MAIHYTDTIYQGINHHGMQVGFVYDNIGMIYVKDIDASGIDIRVLPKQEQDYFYDLLRGDDLGSGTSFPGTKKYGDRFYRTDLSKYYKWDGYDWCVYGETYYLMLDYFPTKSGYLKTGARVYRTDEDKEYRYSGSAWVEITATSGDTKKRIQSKDNMTVVTSDDESSSFYYRINETDVLTSEHWFVVPLAKFLGTGDSSAGFQVYWGKTMYPQRFQIDVSGFDPSWTIDSVDFTLQSQETTPPISDIIDAVCTDGGSDIWYYDVVAFIGGLYYRKFTVNYHYPDGMGGDIYDSYVDDLTGVIGRLLCDEYDPYYHTEAYSTFKYVNDATGDDTDTGGISDPWKTIQKAATTVTAGTLVQVAAGTYTGKVTVANSGTSTTPIHYHADIGVILDGEWDIRKEYIIVDGFELTDSNLGIYLYATQHCLLINNCIHHLTAPSTANCFEIRDSPNNFMIGNTMYDISSSAPYAYGIKMATSASSSNVIIFNKVFGTDLVYHPIADFFYNNYLSSTVNEIGNFCEKFNLPDTDLDCINPANEAYYVDNYAVAKLGVAHNKSLSINWLETHLKYGVAGLISYALTPYLRHLKTVNVPAAGATVPHSFVKVIDANSKERLVAYSNKTEGTDYGACEIGENGEIIDGMDNVKIQSVNGANYSINPISRILDRNVNGDIIIEGRSIIHE